MEQEEESEEEKLLPSRLDIPRGDIGGQADHIITFLEEEYESEESKEEYIPIPHQLELKTKNLIVNYQGD